MDETFKEAFIQHAEQDGKTAASVQDLVGAVGELKGLAQGTSARLESMDRKLDEQTKQNATQQSAIDVGKSERGNLWTRLDEIREMSRKKSGLLGAGGGLVGVILFGLVDYLWFTATGQHLPIFR